MSDYSDRLDKIREGRDKTYASVDNNVHMYKSLPRMHRDLYWLLEIVETMVDEQSFKEAVAESKMMGIMS